MYFVIETTVLHLTLCTYKLQLVSSLRCGVPVHTELTPQKIRSIVDVGNQEQNRVCVVVMIDGKPS